eukprot:2753348-Pleurochrysis_carterae.AAC.1
MDATGRVLSRHRRSVLLSIAQSARASFSRVDPFASRDASRFALSGEFTLGAKYKLRLPCLAERDP